MAVDTTTAVYNCSLIFRPREPDFHSYGTQANKCPQVLIWPYVALL